MDGGHDEILPRRGQDVVDEALMGSVRFVCERAKRQHVGGARGPPNCPALANDVLPLKAEIVDQPCRVVAE
jgi:hypothetical protein